MQVNVRGPRRQDTFDLRDQIQPDDHVHLHAHADAAAAQYIHDDEEHSVLEDDSDGEEHEDYMEDDDDGSSSLSIPNESIDFDLVYSLHSFAATVEGQANVVKGDSLFLMDDSNSYWWLVRVLKTQEVGYIPAENIETPFERLARLNKHRNIDLASATQAELSDNLSASQDRLRNNLNSRAGSNGTPSPILRVNESRAQKNRSVMFTPAFSVHRYLPAIWNDDEEDDPNEEWDEEGYEDEDQELANEQLDQRRAEELGSSGMEPDDGMSWDEHAVQEMQARQMRAAQQNQQAQDHILQQQQQQQQQQLLQQQQQQQRELMAQQQLEQQLQQQQQKALADQQAPQASPPHTLRPSNSRERLISPQDVSPQEKTFRHVDPAQATETRKLTVTPTIARESDDHPPTSGGGPLLPSAIIEKQAEERAKRMRDDDQGDDARKKSRGKEKMAPPVSSASLAKGNAAGKLRKEKEHRELEDENGKDKKKKGSMFGGLFGRKKDKGRERNTSIGSLESGELIGRGSEESSRSGHRPPAAESTVSITAPSTQQQQQQQILVMKPSNTPEAKRIGQQQQQLPETPERGPPVSQHASQLRQRDQQQQALYQQYLNRSPSSPPEAPSYGLQSASAVLAGNSFHGSPGGPGSSLGPPAAKPRPGSLILTQSIMDGQGSGVPELSVIRVFAGKNLQTEATFKTVLLNSSTSSDELIRQALQRFRLSAGEEENDYYLTVKQVEGGASAVLLPAEKPLVVFETLVVEAMELPKVKRSSVGSISSVASNLSQHPAIKKLPMNDFTDDSAVKFYLNRKIDDKIDDSALGHGDDDGDHTLMADSSFESEVHTPLRPTYLSPPGSNVTPDRFSSPSFRFALQVVIYPNDLPDDMSFHPYTEAIVFKDSLRDGDATAPPTVSPGMRKKVFVLPKNVTVAEVIELSLERFGIEEGVVDGGDEIEDKMSKRRSSSRVRYGLVINMGSQEKELSPSGRVIDAFPRPPTFRAPERPASLTKRRSIDSAQVLGTGDDVGPDDPIFILRRAISYRNTTNRHRNSAPLDEIALQQLHRESMSSSSGSGRASPAHDVDQKQPSRQEIIARQREATRANQRAILSAQSNSVRGMDLLLPGNAMLRSSRYDSNDKMRYSYVDTDGETYDISDIVEEELRENNTASRNDLLEGVIGRKDAGGEKLGRVLSKIRNGKSKEKDIASLSSMDSSRRSATDSEYSLDYRTDTTRPGARSVSPQGTGSIRSRSPHEISSIPPRAASAASALDKSSFRTGTTPAGKHAPGASRRQPSIASVMSDLSGYATPQGYLSISEEDDRAETPKPQSKRLLVPKDDFGVSHMIAFIECKASKPKTSLPPLTPADELLFGRPIDMQTLHPTVRDIYAGAFKQLEDMDKVLDDYLVQAQAGS